MSQLSDRLGLLQYLINTLFEDTQLDTYPILINLWELLVLKSKLSAEKDIFFKWIKPLCEKGNPQMIKLFREAMLIQTDFENITMEGLACFYCLFKMVNLEAGKLKKEMKSASVANSGGTIIQGTVTFHIKLFFLVNY